MEIKVNNLKCGGCEGTVTRKLQEIFKTEAIVDSRQGIVIIDINESEINKLEETLSKLGYPPVGSSNPLHSQAKSFVSCAIGKVNEKINK